MRYKGFYIKISPDINIRRVDKKGRDILCEGFLIQVFADETERIEIDNFSAAVGFEILETALRRRCSLRRILWSVSGRSISRLLSKIYRD